MSTVDNVAIAYSDPGWYTVASYSPPGGQIFVLRKILANLLTDPTSFDTFTQLNSWRVMVNNSPVDGLTGLLIDPVRSFAQIDCFLLCGADKTIKVQRYLPDADVSGVSTTSARWHMRLYGQLLLTQNVTLPWEPCNVE